MSVAWRHWTVAVTGMNARADNPGPGQAVARCLREAPGFSGRILGLGHDALDPGLYRRESCDAGYLLPYPSAGESALIERLAEIHAAERIDALIPCLDAELPGFIRLEKRLAAMGIRVLLPGAARLRARAKDSLPELCRLAGVDTPPIRRLTGPDSLETLASETGWGWPLVVKGGFYDAVIVRNPGEAKSAFQRLAAQWGYPVLVQPFIDGHEVNLAGLGDGAGGLAGAVSMRKRALTDKGKAWAGITIRDRALEEMAEKLVAALNWRGPLEVEAMRGTDGRLWLIEINPRFPAWIWLSHAAGRNLPAALLDMLSGAAPKLEPAPAGIMFIRYAEELALRLEEFERMMVHGVAGGPVPLRALAAE
jgi:carbamoyl-phosphate synthase large subunit